MDLRGCVIVRPEDSSGWVDQAAQDLAGYAAGAVTSGLNDAAGRAVVLIGKQTVAAAAGRWPELGRVGLGGLSDQGFVLRTVRSGSAQVVVCAGGGSRGDAYAVIELIKSLVETDGALVLEETARREEPFFIRRGMYAHQHWAYAYPYALRTWKLDDWRRYVDLLAYLKINFFSIWSMVGILPVPLSESDREYLENYREVIDYAKNRRGMEVFIGECANNVAESDGGVPVQQRRYFDVEVLKDPSDPAQFADIMANRRNLYQVADNADGYWIIDSDPGGFEGSPAAEFVDILVGNRQLIDQHARKGPNAKLAYWMWMGWAAGKPREQREHARRAAVEQMRDRLKEPWTLFVCWPDHMDAARDMGYIDKSIFLPYGTIEDEPSPPTTRLRFDEMYFHLNNAISVWGLRSAMGNAQTPFAQLPNIFFFAECAWNGVPESLPPDAEVVSKLARLLCPDATELADAWLMLKEPDPDAVLECVARLERSIGNGRMGPGALGRRFGPGVERLAEDLAMQLRVHAQARRLIAALSATSPQEEVGECLSNYYAAALMWRDIHDFQRYMNYGPDVNQIAALWATYREHAKPAEDLLNSVRTRLIERGCRAEFVDGFLSLTPVGPQTRGETRSGG